MRAAFAITGVLLTVCLILAAFVDVFREWRPIQAEFRELALARAETDNQRDAVERLDGGIQQIYLPELGRTDRCQTCHLGIENPSMKGAPQPHATHPGALLASHPPQKFGCTVCHAGQGLATTTAAAHANDIEHWPEPMLRGPMVEASCERCHRGIDVKGAALLNDGRRLFTVNGCAGCHKVYGKGGVLGPELTNLGKESIFIKHPAMDSLEHYQSKAGGDLNIGYIMEAIEDPAAQPASTTMPAYELSDWEVKALTAYIKGLSDEDVPSSLRPREVFRAEPPSGAELFVTYCSACHGRQGEGGYKIGRMGTALHNEDFLALASPQLIRAVIERGRNSHNKVMPAWREAVGGLSGAEIDRVVEFILSWRTPAPSLAEVRAANGSLTSGTGLYWRNCADCHGDFREGKIGPSLLAPEFFQVASERMLYATLAKGRPGTAMPAWNDLSAEQLKSLLMFLQSHDQPYTPVSAVSTGGSANHGKRIFRGRCATCHGLKGEGGIGPSLTSPELHTLADHRFWAKTLVDGRKDAGMPSWSQLSATDLAAVVAHVKTLGSPTRLARIPSGVGDAAAGRDNYRAVCAACHGNYGEGGSAPALGDPDFLATVSDRFLLGIAKYGRSGTEMRANGQVPGTLVDFTDQQLLDIVAHIRTLDGGVVRQTVRGSVQAGHDWYHRVCAGCHGAAGRGGTGPALANPMFLATASDGFLQATMALGRSGTEMRPMTPYAGGLVELDRTRINDVIAYLRDESQRYGNEPRFAQTAFGAIGNGREWFDSICSNCHGKIGRGTVAAPGLNDRTFLGYASDGFLQGTIIRGRMHTGMRDFGLHGNGIASLTARQVTDIVTFIRSWNRPLIAGATKEQD